MALSTCTAVALSRGVADTQDLAAALAERLEPGDVVCLFGELGAGKTYFTKGLVAGLGGDGDEVTSPTFVLMQVYEGRLPVYHFDAYRLAGGDELVDIGSDETLSGDGVGVIEWADRVSDALPADRIEVRLRVVGPEERRIELVGRGDHGAACVGELIAEGRLDARDGL